MVAHTPDRDRSFLCIAVCASSPQPHRAPRNPFDRHIRVSRWAPLVEGPRLRHVQASSPRHAAVAGSLSPAFARASSTGCSLDFHQPDNATSRTHLEACLRRDAIEALRRAITQRKPPPVQRAARSRVDVRHRCGRVFCRNVPALRLKCHKHRRIADQPANWWSNTPERWRRDAPWSVPQLKLPKSSAR